MSRRISFEGEEELFPVNQGSEDVTSPASVATLLTGLEQKSPTEDGRNLGSTHGEALETLVQALGDGEDGGPQPVTAAAALGKDIPRRGQRPVKRASSSPALAVLAGSAKKSPLRAKPPFVAPRIDRRGAPNFKPRPNDRLQHGQEWNENHHLTGLENHLLPTELRRYFCRPQTRPELLEDLAKASGRSRSSRALLSSMELPDVTLPKRPTVSADAGQPVLPERHAFGGAMRDRDGDARAWNDRWQNSMSQLNDQCHPDHRAYFTQKSLFEMSPSHQYRRYLDQEIEHGVWVPTATRKAEHFPPMGGRLRGRSGTPVPFATC